MALNPAYAQQSTRKLPLAFGYVYGTGELVDSIVGADGSNVGVYVLGDGEWDGSVLYANIAKDKFIGPLVGLSGTVPHGRFLPTSFTLLSYFHFHGGAYSTKGLPNSLGGAGPDQAGDYWLTYFPSITPYLTFSGMAYYIAKTSPIGTASAANLAPVGIWRSTKCRIFDGNGEVSGYTFTVNPTWQMIEAVLRFKVKRQQAGLMGLTNAEKARFDWPAMVDHAARNAALLPNGAPRFTGNYMFAADSKLTNIVETMLRGCRSYKRERGGVLSFCGDDPRSTVFTFSQRNLVPGSLKIGKKDLSTAANLFIPQYRELGIPAVSEVVSATTFDGANGWQTTFVTKAAQPFFANDYFTYSGSADDTDFAGDYQVFNYGSLVNNYYVNSAPPIANQFDTNRGVNSLKTTTGGYLGTQQSRFKQYAPRVVQHRAHQRMCGQVAPGIASLPRCTEVQYDMGNTTFDQSNRVMQYMMTRELGPDVAGWTAPFKGSFTAYLECVDDAGNAVLELEDRDRITLDETAGGSFAGDYEILEHAVHPPIGKNAGSVDFVIQAYQPTAFTDTSYPPGDSYQTLPNSSLPTAEVMSFFKPFWVLQCTPVASIVSGALSITVADLSVQWIGRPAPTKYASITLAGIPLDTQIVLYLVFANDSTLPTLVLGTVTPPPAFSPYPLPLPDGYFVVFWGTVSSGSGTYTGGYTTLSLPVTGGTAATLAVGGFTTAGVSGGLIPPTATIVEVSPDTVSASSGPTVTLTATVASTVSGTPTGTVQFASNGSALGSPVALVDGVATLAGESFTPAGSYTITAAYSGDTTYDSSGGSATLTVTA